MATESNKQQIFSLKILIYSALGIMVYLIIHVFLKLLVQVKVKLNKTGVINDPLGQPTVPAGSDCRLIIKFWDGRTDGHSV